MGHYCLKRYVLFSKSIIRKCTMLHDFHFVCNYCSILGYPSGLQFLPGFLHGGPPYNWGQIHTSAIFTTSKWLVPLPHDNYVLFRQPQQVLWNVFIGVHHDQVWHVIAVFNVDIVGSSPWPSLTRNRSFWRGYWSSPCPSLTRDCCVFQK